ncbi:hypothetical protein B0H21DRAFT_97552 [Amylocystis lapponica]|nr:hypothetical protein B0H21DRAFT_97552 [Amylocystis lapponica]
MEHESLTLVPVRVLQRTSRRRPGSRRECPRLGRRWRHMSCDLLRRLWHVQMFQTHRLRRPRPRCYRLHPPAGSRSLPPHPHPHPLLPPPTSQTPRPSGWVDCFRWGRAGGPAHIGVRTPYDTASRISRSCCENMVDTEQSLRGHQLVLYTMSSDHVMNYGILSTGIWSHDPSSYAGGPRASGARQGGTRGPSRTDGPRAAPASSRANGGRS